MHPSNERSMTLNLCDHEHQAQKAIKAFWRGRDDARARQAASGKQDQGERAGVTAGKNMDGFATLVADVVRRNGMPDAEIHQKKALLTLPGFYRPTKLWDMLVMHQGRLVAAIEFKSQVGPSFGNNFNNRCEEALGTAHDFWTAHREGAFGAASKPFVAWLMVVEDAPGSTKPVKDKSPHFPVFPEFSGASYQRRYDLLCGKLMQERLYSAAGVIATPRTAAKNGDWHQLSEPTSLRAMLAALAGHVASEAMRQV
jgi:hypothetical protein